MTARGQWLGFIGVKAIIALVLRSGSHRRQCQIIRAATASASRCGHFG